MYWFTRFNGIEEKHITLPVVHLIDVFNKEIEDLELHMICQRVKQAQF